MTTASVATVTAGCREVMHPSTIQWPHSQHVCTRTHIHICCVNRLGNPTHLHLKCLLVHAHALLRQHNVWVLTALVAVPHAGHVGVGVALARDGRAAHARPAHDPLGAPGAKSAKRAVVLGHAVLCCALLEESLLVQPACHPCTVGAQQAWQQQQCSAQHTQHIAARRSLACLALDGDVGGLVLGPRGRGHNAGHQHQLAHIRLGLQHRAAGRECIVVRRPLPSSYGRGCKHSWRATLPPTRCM